MRLFRDRRTMLCPHCGAETPSSGGNCGSCHRLLAAPAAPNVAAATLTPPPDAETVAASTGSVRAREGTGPLAPGDSFGARYRILHVLGAGGMGVVYEVERSADNARLALKLISGFAGMRELARFAREGKLAATVDHPNVVRLYDASVSKTGFSPRNGSSCE